MDEQLAARTMVEHLLSLGHRRIAHVSGIADHGASRWRLAGCREAIAGAGSVEDPALAALPEIPGLIQGHRTGADERLILRRCVRD